MAKSQLKLVTPTRVIRTVTPRRPKNSDLRTREHLTPSEVDKLIEAARSNRYGHRDATMILVAYRHGLRVAELVDLRWDQVDFNAAVLHARRVKNGTPSTHPIQGDELRTLRRLKREGELGLIKGLYALCPYIAGEWPQNRYPSSIENNGILLDLHNNRGAVAYGIEALKARDPLAWPGFASEEDVKGFPPTIISVNECDPLRDEGKAYADRLQRGGVEVQYTCHQGMIHHFYAMAGAIPYARTAIKTAGQAIRKALM